MKSDKMNKINTKAKICKILSIINILILFLLPGKFISVGSYVSILFGVAGILIYILVKKEFDTLKDTNGKNPAKFGFIASIVCIALSFINLLSMVILNDPEITSQVFCIDKNIVNNCATTSDELTSCKYMDTLDIQCYTEVLDKEQYK